MNSISCFQSQGLPGQFIWTCYKTQTEMILHQLPILFVEQHLCYIPVFSKLIKLWENFLWCFFLFVLKPAHSDLITLLCLAGFSGSSPPTSCVILRCYGGFSFYTRKYTSLIFILDLVKDIRLGCLWCLLQFYLLTIYSFSVTSMETGTFHSQILVQGDFLHRLFLTQQTCGLTLANQDI